MNESILFELLVVLFFFPICVGKILFWQLKKGIPTYHFYDYIAYFIYLVYCLIIHPHCFKSCTYLQNAYYKMKHFSY